MKTSPDPNPHGSDKPSRPLTKVLGPSEEVKDLVDAAAEELSSVSADLSAQARPGATRRSCICTLSLTLDGQP